MNRLRVVFAIFLFAISFSSFSNNKVRMLVSCVDYVPQSEEVDRCKGYSFKTNDAFFNAEETALQFSKGPPPAYRTSLSVTPKTNGIPGFAENSGNVPYCGVVFIKNSSDNTTTLPCMVQNARGIHWDNKTSTDIVVQLQFDLKRNGNVDSSCTCVGPEPAS